MTRSRDTELDRLVPASEACLALGISRRTLARLIARGRIRAVKSAPHMRGRVLVTVSEIESYVSRLVRA
jgi:excisionase family DNA binding protein